MTALLKLIHVLAILCVGVGFIGALVIAMVLVGQWTGALTMILVAPTDLVIMVAILIGASGYLHYTGDPENLATYLKHKLGSEDDE